MWVSVFVDNCSGLTSHHIFLGVVCFCIAIPTFTCWAVTCIQTFGGSGLHPRSYRKAYQNNSQMLQLEIDYHWIYLVTQWDCKYSHQKKDISHKNDPIFRCFFFIFLTSTWSLDVPPWIFPHFPCWTQVQPRGQELGAVVTGRCATGSVGGPGPGHVLG